MSYLLRVLDQKEKCQRENQPYEIVEQVVTADTWLANHPDSWTVIGSMAGLDAASMTDVTDWSKGRDGPNNAVLVRAGDIAPQQARA